MYAVPDKDQPPLQLIYFVLHEYRLFYVYPSIFARFARCAIPQVQLSWQNTKSAASNSAQVCMNILQNMSTVEWYSTKAFFQSPLHAPSRRHPSRNPSLLSRLPVARFIPSRRLSSCYQSQGHATFHVGLQRRDTSDAVWCNITMQVDFQLRNITRCTACVAVLFIQVSDYR